MSRKRHISTDISTDNKIAELSEKGILPLLLYTWAIPHMDDWGRITGEARQFKLLVCPALDVTTKEVDQALHDIHSAGLWTLYEAKGKKVAAIHPDNWFRHQSYINVSKRTDDSGSVYPRYDGPQGTATNSKEQQETPTNSKERQETAQNTVSPSPSPSLSPTPTPTPTKFKGVGDSDESPRKFIKPTVDEVRDYCEERNNGVDAEHWMAHYTANGWRVGKAPGKPMKDWKSAVITWEKRDKESRGSSTIGRTGEAAYHNKPSKPTWQDHLDNFMREG